MVNQPHGLSAKRNLHLLVLKPSVLETGIYPSEEILKKLHNLVI
jgi:hypothetical protein